MPGASSPMIASPGSIPVGYPVVLTQSAVGNAQLIYEARSNPGAHDVVTVWGGSLDAIARKVRLLWGAQDAAYALAPLSCPANAGMLRVIDLGQLRGVPGTLVGIWAYTDVADVNQAVVKVDARIVND